MILTSDLKYNGPLSQNVDIYGVMGKTRSLKVFSKKGPYSGNIDISDIWQNSTFSK